MSNSNFGFSNILIFDENTTDACYWIEPALI